MARSSFLDRGGQRAALSERREECPYVVDEQIRRFEGGEVAAPLELCPRVIVLSCSEYRRIEMSSAKTATPVGVVDGVGQFPVCMFS